MFYTFQNRLVLHGTLTTTTALRIGAGRNSDSTTVDLPLLKDSLGKPFIPGSSFKGVLRSRIESLLRTLLPGRRTGACNPIEDTERCITPQELAAEKKRRTADDQFTQWVLDNSCPACQLFGSPWLASRVQVRDWQVDEEFWFAQFQVRDGVAINRDTETASDQQLYSYEVIPAGTRFTGTLLVENADDWQLGLLLAGLREFEQGLALGGAASRGLGSVQLAWNENSRYIHKDHLLTYLEDAKTAGEPYQAKEARWKQEMLTELKQRRNGQEETHA